MNGDAAVSADQCDQNHLYRKKSCLLMRHVLILALILVAALFIPVSAINETTISFSDLSLVSKANLEIYGFNTTNLTWDYLGLYNTSSTGLEFEPGSYQVVLRPSSVGRLTNPVTLLTDAFSFLETYWLQILLGFALIVAIIRRW